MIAAVSDRVARGRALFVSALVLTLLIGGAWFTLDRDGGPSPAGSQVGELVGSQPSLVGKYADLIVTGELVGLDAFEPAHGRIATIEITRVVWAAETFVDSFLDELLPQEAPSVGQRLAFGVQASEWVLQTGEDYTMFLTTKSTSEELNWYPADWFATLGLDADGRLVAGSPPAYKVELDRGTRSGETALAVMVDLMRENQDRRTNDFLNGSDSPLGPRAASLLPEKPDDSGGDIEPLVNRPADSRQLPGLEETDRTPDAYGLEAFTYWSVTILHDETDDRTAFGVYFPEVGFLGPNVANTIDGLNTLEGYGPAASELVLFVWRDMFKLDVRTEIPVPRPSRSDAGASMMSEGGTLLVDVRTDAVEASYLSVGEFDQLLREQR